MKAAHILLLILLFFWQTSKSMGSAEQLETKTNSSLSNTISSISLAAASFFLEIINFDLHESQDSKRAKQDHQSTKTKISPNLVIVASSNTIIKEDGNYLVIDKEYFGPNLTGKWYYYEGELYNRKGKLLIR